MDHVICPWRSLNDLNNFRVQVLANLSLHPPRCIPGHSEPTNKMIPTCLSDEHGADIYRGTPSTTRANLKKFGPTNDKGPGRDNPNKGRPAKEAETTRKAVLRNEMPRREGGEQVIQTQRRVATAPAVQARDAVPPELAGMFILLFFLSICLTLLRAGYR